MTEQKYTDYEVMKGIECCIIGDCGGCPINTGSACRDYLFEGALSLINRQKAEIERLQKAYTKGQEIFSEQCLENERLKVEIERLEAMIDAAEEHFAPLPFKNKFDEYIEKSKAEAIKKFSERLKKECLFDRGYEILQGGTIDHLVKEFTEEKT